MDKRVIQIPRNNILQERYQNPDASRNWEENISNILINILCVDGLAPLEAMLQWTGQRQLQDKTRNI